MEQLYKCTQLARDYIKPLGSLLALPPLPSPLTLGCKHSPPGLILHLATSRFESKSLNDADLEGGVSPYSTALEGWHVT